MKNENGKAMATTLNVIQENELCVEGWEKLLGHLGKTKADDELLLMTTILDVNGLEETLWLLRCLPEYEKLWRKYTIWCVEQVRHLLKDARSIGAIDVAQRHLAGLATNEDLMVAKKGAEDARVNMSRGLAKHAANAAVWVTWQCEDMEDISLNTLDAAHDAALAFGNVAAAEKVQEEKLRQIFTTGTWEE